MVIELKPEHQQVIDSAIRSGAYQDQGEVLDQAFAMIRFQITSEDWMAKEREAVAAKISSGFAQSERGDVTEVDAALEMLRQRRRDQVTPRK